MQTCKGSCHCGRVKFEVEVPDTVNVSRCNCSICNRLGALWAYYDEGNVEVTVGVKTKSTYSWGEKTMLFHRCNECGCTTHYTAAEDDGRELIAVNCRMAELSDVSKIPVREFDGLFTWKYMDE